MYSSSSQLRLAEERGEKFIFERNITYFFFVIGALLNFVPQMAGYNFIFDKESSIRLLLNFLQANSKRSNYK